MIEAGLARLDDATRRKPTNVVALELPLYPLCPPPRITILSASSGNGRCSALASIYGARIQTSRSLSVVRITGFGFGRIASTMAFGSRQEAIDKVRA